MRERLILSAQYNKCRVSVSLWITSQKSFCRRTLSSRISTTLSKKKRQWRIGSFVTWVAQFSKWYWFLSDIIRWVYEGLVSFPFCQNPLWHSRKSIWKMFRHFKNSSYLRRNCWIYFDLKFSKVFNIWTFKSSLKSYWNIIYF